MVAQPPCTAGTVPLSACRMCLPTCQDVKACQLLIVMGTSLNVSPVSEMINLVSPRYGNRCG